MNRIAILTSGGDAPGMNAAVRAATRAARGLGWEVYGVQKGFAGLMSDTMEPLRARDVDGILERGGTVLGSARSSEFRDAACRSRALGNLRQRGGKAAETPRNLGGWQPCDLNLGAVVIRQRSGRYGVHATIAVDCGQQTQPRAFLRIQAVDRLDGDGGEAKACTEVGDGSGDWFIFRLVDFQGEVGAFAIDAGQPAGIARRLGLPPAAQAAFDPAAPPAG